MRRRLTGMQPVAYIAAAKGGLAALGLYLAWASTPLYPYYETTPRIWGLSPTEDQNVGGVIMMVEQSMTLVLVLVVLFVRMLGQSEEEERRRERLEAAQASRTARLALEQRPVLDPPRALDAHAAAHDDVAAEAHVALDLEPRAGGERGRAGGEALLEVADQLVVVGVELDVRRAAVALRDEPDAPVVAEPVGVRADDEQVARLLDGDEAARAARAPRRRPRTRRSPRPSPSRAGPPRARRSPWGRRSCG